MKKNHKRHLRILVTALLGLAFSVGAISFVSADQAPWNVDFTKTAGNSAIGYTSYRSMQGLGFDTYSGKDGYVFVLSDDKKYYSLIHFTMDGQGWCIRTKKQTYTPTQVGHANDATVYKDASGNKWLFVALYGAWEETIDGVNADLRVIKLSEYNSGTKKVYNCDVSAIKNVTGVKSITGITYIGKTYNENGQKVPTFVLLSGNTMVQAYLTQSGTTMTFSPTGTKGRIVKPSGFKAQGVTYHNNYLYMAYEGESDTKSAVTRICCDELFTDGDHEMEKVELSGSNYIKAEGVFFTSLDRKSNVYIGVNRRTSSGVDDDAILRSNVRY